jgi:glycosyltransferase involved in cell wall biosynthesis
VRRLLHMLSPMRPRQWPIVLPHRPHPAETKYRLGLVIIVRDEASYIEEWLEFHLMQGFQHIVVYDNGSSDDTAKLASSYVARGVVTLVPWATFQGRLNNQSLAYAHALVNFGSWFDWLGFLDADEFLFPTVENSIAGILNELSHLPALAVPWSMFGTSGHVEMPQGLVIASYVEKAIINRNDAPAHAINAKSIVRPDKVTAVQGAHMFHIEGMGQGAYLETGDWLAKSRKSNLCNLSPGRLQLNHYYTRSASEFDRKLAKGSVRGVRFFDPGRYEQVREWIDRETVEDKAIMTYLPELKRRLAALRG